jgi:hypothetical protein
MKILLEQLGIALCGLITTVVVVIVNVSILHWTGWNLVGFSYDFIPAGAIGGGAIAASGYYFGALYTQNRANRSLLVLMVIIAGLAQVSMYWYDYVSLDTKGTSFNSFAEFINFRITTTHIRFRTLDFKVGWFGYALSMVDFAGFLAGGFVAFFLLEAEKQCSSCKLYLKSLGSKRRVVEDVNSAIAYREGIGKLISGDSAALETINKSGTPPKTIPGSVRVSTTLRVCPVCKRQFAEQEVELYVGDNDWKTVSALTKFDEVAAGVDLVPFIRAIDPPAQPTDARP